MSQSKFRNMAEEFVKVVNEESSDLDAIERIEQDLEVYYEDVANEPDEKPTSKLLTSGQVGNLYKDQLKKQREAIHKKWDELGFLEGLKGHVKPNIAAMMCCEASSLLNETVVSGATDLKVYEKEGQVKK